MNGLTIFMKSHLQVRMSYTEIAKNYGLQTVEMLS